MFGNITIKDIRKELGNLFRQQRAAHKLSQQELGELLDMSKTTIHKLESGQNATLDTVLKVANHFDLLDKLLEGIKELQADTNINPLY